MSPSTVALITAIAKLIGASILFGAFVWGVINGAGEDRKDEGGYRKIH